MTGPELQDRIKKMLGEQLGTRPFNFAAKMTVSGLSGRQRDYWLSLSGSVTGEAAVIVSLGTQGGEGGEYTLRCRRWRYPSGASISPYLVSGATSLLVISLGVWIHGLPAYKLYGPIKELGIGLQEESRSLRSQLQRRDSTCTVTPYGPTGDISSCPSCGQRAHRRASELMYTCPTCQMAWVR